MTRDVRELLRMAHECTAQFLEHNLPTICDDDWWKKCVRWKLSVPQERVLDEGKISELGGLDLAALLRVVEKNWRELSFSLRLPREGRTLINEVRNIRNRLAHESLEEISMDDRLRDVDTLQRYFSLINADDSVIKSAKKLHKELMKRVMDGKTGPSDEVIIGETIDTPQLFLERDILSDSPDDEKGIPVAYIGTKAVAVDAVRDAMSKATYVGIDFGTSTTVVSVMRPNDETQGMSAEPIPITQWTETGLQIDDHLVPTCLAWVGEKLLVGQGAARLKSELTEGRNVWSSFKMKLGIDLGPQYPNTDLVHGRGSVVIERPRDAATAFFGYIREAVEDYVQEQGLPPRIYYAVSVPAAFEANQRQDLILALADAGIPVEESSLIDEPNSAFLSYLVEMEINTTGRRFFDSLVEKERRVLVFDFGAGTCDISLLEVKVENERLSSRNLAISKFIALGGDDIDLAIARQILLPQLCQGKTPTDIFTTNDLESVVLPRLKPEAEGLKIQCSRMAEDGGYRTLADLRQQVAVIRGKPVPPIKVREERWELSEPKISLKEFADIIAPFLADPSTSNEEVHGQTPSVLEPISSAIEKADMKCDDLDMVLFIGGSSENPVVRATIEEHMGRFVDCVTPRDLRAHVSQGAAVHSLFVYGLGSELISPITSEPIYVVTRDEGLELVLQAGIPVPSPDIAVTELRIDRKDQRKVELPFCVSGKEKILGIVSIRAPSSPGYFNAGETVRLSCTITRDKLLKVRVRIGNTSLTAQIMNPLANAELTPRNRSLLKARQALNESILAGKGRPSVTTLLTYADAAGKARRWREAAEVMEAVERLEPERNLATNISYNYSMADDRVRTDRWSTVAYERSPDSLTAYNFALSRLKSGDDDEYEALMEESLRLNPEYHATLTVYGHYLKDQGDPRGMELIEKAYELLSNELSLGILNEQDYFRLSEVAGTLGKEKTLKDLRDYKDKRGQDEELYREEHLVVGDDRNTRKFAE